MEITEVRIKLMEDSDDRLQAFCSITFDDCFVVRDLKIIEGAHGAFVAMPSRKLSTRCAQCGGKNVLRSSYCNHCGKKQQDEPLPRDADGRPKLYADIAHPINSKCREMVQSRVIQEYREELDRAQQPGYLSRYDDSYDDSYDDEFEFVDEQEQEQEQEPSEPERKEAAAEAATVEPSQAESCDEPQQDEAAEPALPPLNRPHTQLQPPESQPRGPHTRSGRSVQPQPENTQPQKSQEESRQGRPDDDFGAGIF